MIIYTYISMLVNNLNCYCGLKNENDLFLHLTIEFRTDEGTVECG